MGRSLRPLRGVGSWGALDFLFPHTSASPPVNPSPDSDGAVSAGFDASAFPSAEASSERGEASAERNFASAPSLAPDFRSAAKRRGSRIPASEAREP